MSGAIRYKLKLLVITYTVSATLGHWQSSLKSQGSQFSPHGLEFPFSSRACGPSLTIRMSRPNPRCNRNKRPRLLWYYNVTRLRLRCGPLTLESCWGRNPIVWNPKPDRRRRESNFKDTSRHLMECVLHTKNRKSKELHAI